MIPIAVSAASSVSEVRVAFVKPPSATEVTEESKVRTPVQAKPPEATPLATVYVPPVQGKVGGGAALAVSTTAEKVVATSAPIRICESLERNIDFTSQRWPHLWRRAR